MSGRRDDIRRLLVDARKLISTMDPRPESTLDGVDALVHRALLLVEELPSEVVSIRAKRPPLPLPEPKGIEP